MYKENIKGFWRASKLLFGKLAPPPSDLSWLRPWYAIQYCNLTVFFNKWQNVTGKIAIVWIWLLYCNNSYFIAWPVKSKARSGSVRSNIQRIDSSSRKKSIRWTTTTIISTFQGKNVRAVVVINPENPLGVVFGAAELAGLANWTYQCVVWAIDRSHTLTYLFWYLCFWSPPLLKLLASIN